MNWKLIFQLSLFGLAMGLATVFLIPSRIEPFFWLAIFILSACLIATQCANKYFLHGILVGLANCAWITTCHIVFFSQYAAGHAREMEIMKSMPFPDFPRLMMVLAAPAIGVISGVVIGVFAAVGGKFSAVANPAYK